MRNGAPDCVSAGGESPCPVRLLRFYARDGTELGRYAVGDYVSALAVAPPQREGAMAQVWVGLSKEVVGLEWQRW